MAELEEELDDSDDTSGQDTPVSPENALTGHENEVVSEPDTVVQDTADLVTVVALVTLCVPMRFTPGMSLWILCCRERRSVSLPVWQPK